MLCRVDEFNVIDVEYRVCLCCGERFFAPRTIEQPLCKKCYEIAVKELFKKENGELKISDFREKVKELVNNNESD
jgi:hypothetical protein